MRFDTPFPVDAIRRTQAAKVPDARSASARASSWTELRSIWRVSVRQRRLIIAAKLLGLFLIAALLAAVFSPGIWP